jgi:hypothetical protein
MASRALWLHAIVGAVVFGGLLRPAAAQEKPKKITSMVVRYLAHQDDGRFRYLGRPVMVLAVEPIDGGRPVELIVPNRGWDDPKNGKYDPIPQVAENVRNLKRGDVIKIEVEHPTQQQGRPLVREAKRYTVKPGEGEPNTYVFKSNFRNKEGRSNFMAVVLSRFDEQTTVAVQQHRDKEGDMVSDPAILELLGKLKGGELVEAEIKDGGGRTPMLTSLERYAPRQNGKFLKMTEVDVDGQKAPAVELQREGKPVTTTISGKLQGKRWTPDPRILSAARKLKPDTDVTFRARDDDGRLILKDIEPAPKQADATAAASRGGRPTKMEKEKETDKSDK